ncbi:MAG TPA: nucleotide sugar dehydrogenase [Sandaracinaceae bacterium]
MSLADRILSRDARVAVVGLGYVGLPLAVEFAKAGFHVLGVDIDQAKVAAINRGESYVADVPTAELRPLVEDGLLEATTDAAVLASCDTVDICVPTPLRKTKDPDLSYVVQAAQAIKPHLHRDMLIVLESTTYPGTTEELLLPLFEETGLKVGEDFFLAFSPERVDPGNPVYKTRNTPKIVGGVTPRCTALARALYSQAIETVVPVSSTRVAETVKLLENTFRSVNIGLVNELARMCHAMGINIWEVIDAAKTKPFGFMPFYPGPGLGGHCIPIDPFYLSWKARQSGFECRFIELAGQINGAMPEFTVRRVQDALNERGKALRGARIHILGVAYKRDIDDVRESPAIDIIHLLISRGANVSYSDPHVPRLTAHGLDMRSVDSGVEALREVDCAVIVTNHSAFDWRAIVKHAPLIVDTRNALGGVHAANVVRL